jgi:hypothetical protein
VGGWLNERAERSFYDQRKKRQKRGLVSHKTRQTESQEELIKPLLVKDYDSHKSRLH